MDFKNFNFEQLQDMLATSAPIGKGSARKVVSLGNGYAVKIAYNKKGLAQNEVEWYLHNDVYASYFNKCHWISDDMKYLVVDECKKVKHIAHVKKWFESQELIFSDFEYDMADNYNLKGDIARPSSWGIKPNGDYVLVDYGLTENVYKENYLRRK